MAPAVPKASKHQNQLPAPIFTKFLDLPRELRNKIYAFTAHVLRAIYLVELPRYEVDQAWPSEVENQSRLPALLTVWHESNEEMRRY